MNKSIMKKFLISFFSVILLTFTSCETLSLIGDLLGQESDPTAAAVGNSLKSISKASESITPENEYYIGRSVAASITAAYPLYKNAKLTQKYLNDICSALVLNSDVPYIYNGYYVAIMDSDEINAMSTPGGHIFISRGLIQSTESEDALAAVIAHEIAHIQLKHSVSAIKNSRLTSAITSTTKASVLIAADKHFSENSSLNNDLYEELKKSANELLSSQEEIVNALVSSGFSKEQEYQADAYAIRLMSRAGYDPSQMLEMLHKIEDNHTKGGWNQTHPKAEKRIKEAQKVLKTINRKAADKNVRQSRFEKMSSDIM